MPRGSWRARFRFALDASLRVLGPHRRTLSALVPVLIGDSEEGLFAPATAFSRQRVLRVYLDAANGAMRPSIMGRSPKKSKAISASVIVIGNFS